jgi:hypothetical protein
LKGVDDIKHWKCSTAEKVMLWISVPMAERKTIHGMPRCAKRVGFIRSQRHKRESSTKETLSLIERLKRTRNVRAVRINQLLAVNVECEGHILGTASQYHRHNFRLTEDALTGGLQQYRNPLPRQKPLHIADGVSAEVKNARGQHGGDLRSPQSFSVGVNGKPRSPLNSFFSRRSLELLWRRMTPGATRLPISRRNRRPFSQSS